MSTPPYNPNKPMSLDELLSPEALKQLNEFGYVQFKLADNYSDSSCVGWVARKTKTTVEKENVVVSMPSGCF